MSSKIMPSDIGALTLYGLAAVSILVAGLTLQSGAILRILLIFGSLALFALCILRLINVNRRVGPLEARKQCLNT